MKKIPDLSLSWQYIYLTNYPSGLFQFVVFVIYPLDYFVKNMLQDFYNIPGSINMDNYLVMR